MINKNSGTRSNLATTKSGQSALPFTAIVQIATFTHLLLDKTDPYEVHALVIP